MQPFSTDRERALLVKQAADLACAIPAARLSGKASATNAAARDSRPARRIAAPNPLLEALAE